jgi:hypothetical protein
MGLSIHTAQFSAKASLDTRFFNGIFGLIIWRIAVADSSGTIRAISAGGYRRPVRENRGNALPGQTELDSRVLWHLD